MAAWRVAKSLDTLLAQLNATAPRRSKASDGSVGDLRHQANVSDHNPNKLGVVTARDFTDDPAGGLDCNKLAAQLIASGDPRIKYIIWNRRIYTPGRGWAAYKGTNPHDKHLHLSVSEQPGWFDSTLPWALGTNSAGTSGNVQPINPGTRPAPPLTSAQIEENELMAAKDDIIAAVKKRAGLIVSVSDGGIYLINPDEGTYRNLMDNNNVTFHQAIGYERIADVQGAQVLLGLRDITVYTR